MNWFALVKMCARLLLAWLGRPDPTTRATDLSVFCGEYQLRFRQISITPRKRKSKFVEEVASFLNDTPPPVDAEEEQVRLEDYGRQLEP